jgi:hypothetical protein
VQIFFALRRDGKFKENRLREFPVAGEAMRCEVAPARMCAGAWAEDKKDSRRQRAGGLVAGAKRFVKIIIKQ